MHGITRGGKSPPVDLHDVTHILTSLEGVPLVKILGSTTLPPGLVVLSAEWFSQCLTVRTQVPQDEYLVSIDTSPILTLPMPMKEHYSKPPQEPMDTVNSTQAAFISPLLPGDQPGRKAMFTDDMIGNTCTEGEEEDQDDLIPASMGVDLNKVSSQSSNIMQVKW
eukprot:Ihof_evm23s1 gene=Ihof_evmTU23s1